MGCPPWDVPETAASDEVRGFGGTLGLVDVTVGLNVTVRWAFGGIGFPDVDVWWAMDDIRGVVSDELDAMATAIGRLRKTGGIAICTMKVS